MKKSAKGLLNVTNGILTDQCTLEQEDMGDLKTIFLNGEFIKTITLTEIRTKLN